MSTTIDLDDQLKNVSLTEQFMLLSDYVATIDTTFDQEFQNCHDITCLDKIKPPPTLDKLVSMICNYTEKQYYKIFLVSSLCTQSTLKEAYNTLLPMLDDHPLAKNKLIKAYGLVDSKSKRDVFEEAYQVEVSTSLTTNIIQTLMYSLY
ncbi:hypothetical protein CYY_007935 [Polysphondylium violaceum]|uniref:Uncharacterized protein n=1 Tax=Polysphondylium violaceum TaxID=133409 RepID=A0A8J4V4I0_9MYCE|nr:hypothetical protein CYY_007935 [Polysphondylium violaceum]